MSDAREILAMRNTLQLALHPAELRDIHWPSIAAAAGEAVARGWTGDEIARWAIGDMGRDVERPGAVILTTVRSLAAADPPRQTTPTPTSMAEHHRAIEAAKRDSEDVDHATWVKRIREQHAQRRRENAS